MVDAFVLYLFLQYRFIYSNIMILNILLIIIGVAVVLLGADILTKGSVALAQRMKVSQIVIGLTIVAAGTSMPEFFVSFVSAIKGTPDLAIGNVVGSNIFNALLIVGVSAAVTPIAILKGTVRKDIPFACFASLLLLGLCFDGSISRIDAAILFATFLGFLLFTLKNAKSGDEDENEPLANTSVLKSVVFIIGGLAGLIIGSNLFVDSATFVAQQLGVSEAVIGLTIVAGGTSLPELATSVVAAKKGNSGIAIGNVLGSNVFNILAILGLTGIISPMKISGITMLDFALLIVSMLLLWVFSYTKYTIKRWEGFVLIGVFLAYMSYLFMHI